MTDYIIFITNTSLLKNTNVYFISFYNIVKLQNVLSSHFE